MSNLTTSISALSAKQIKDFFSADTGTTQEECNQMAEQLIGQPVRPTPVQGSTSYTVIADNDTWGFVVQFRDNKAALDPKFLECVEQVYKPFMPHHEQVGTLGYLQVCTITTVGGDCVYLSLVQLHRDDGYLLQQSLRDYARFFALAWHNRLGPVWCPSRHGLYEDYLSKLKQLSQGLPKRFRKTVDYLISELPKLFASDWPLVPHHTDLRENNIHVDPLTGEIKGICDWKDTTVGPFGTSLWSLEAMLATRSSKGPFKYHPNHQALRKLFWDSFRVAMGSVFDNNMAVIEVARLVGLFLENGFVYTDDVNRVPVRDGTYELRHLESMTLGL